MLWRWRCWWVCNSKASWRKWAIWILLCWNSGWDSYRFGCTCEWCQEGLGQGNAYIPALLDQSAVFNIINHGVLLDWLSALVVGSIMLQWFSFFLQGQFYLTWGGGVERSLPLDPCLVGIFRALPSLYFFLTFTLCCWRMPSVSMGCSSTSMLLTLFCISQPGS